MHKFIRAKNFFVTLIASISLFISSHVSAQNLSAAQIKLWTEAAPTFAAWFKQHENALNSTEEIDFAKSAPSAVATQAASALKQVKLYNQFENIVKAKGFASVEEFFLIQSEIIQGYMHVAMQAYSVKSEIQQEIKDSLAELDASEFLTQEQKDQMKQQMLNMFQQLQAPSQSAETANQKLIRQYADEIQKALDSFPSDE